MLIEPILGYKSCWRILELLIETPRKMVSRKELFDHTQLGNAPLSNGLQRLVSADLIVKKNFGKKEFYYINYTNENMRLIKELLKKEAKDLRNLEYGIKIIISEFVRKALEVKDINEIILFGSHAKGTASIHSDIDLAILFEKDSTSELELTRITKALEEKFKREIQIHYFTKKTFKQENKLLREIKNDGIPILK